jgi:hypothetical protein
MLLEKRDKEKVLKIKAEKFGKKKKATTFARPIKRGKPESWLNRNKGDKVKLTY